MNHLRNNQIEAIQTSLNNNFENGVHFQATGTGKSRIGLELILHYNKLNPNSNILWLCEKKSILTSQFNKNKLYEIGYEEILKKFLIYNYADKKTKNWYNNINSSKFWNKSTLIIINRTFLTINNNYQNLKIPIHFIIHDECHTIVNQSTTNFYNYLFSLEHKPKIIGLSATPPLLKFPFEKILTSYSIYNAIKDDIIVPPIIQWLETKQKINDIDLINIINKCINKLLYKKIIIWSGMISECLKYAKLFKNSPCFNKFKICLDTSKGCFNYDNYEIFEKQNDYSILFCANKHREGSDIHNLDGCIFLDGVQKRYYKTFVQCIGRVLRKNINKKFGLILDLNAKNAVEIIERINMYLNVPSHIFPWNISYDNYSNDIILHSLVFNLCHNNDSLKSPIQNESIQITKYFKRNVPKQYNERLQFELSMFQEKQLIGYLMKALDILKMTENIPHITRGSCGSSLICYLLGISHTDPMKYNITFSRFLNKYRNTLPDIDFDFPYNKRDEVFLKIEQKWPQKIARISNHIYYHEKSATRQALRNINRKGFISKDDLLKVIKELDDSEKEEFNHQMSLLMDSFKGYSLHCGGIVYYPDGIPEHLLLENDKKKRIIHQITLNKYDISESEIFKIDILSSRGLAQLNHALHDPNYIDFEKFTFDSNVFEMLSNGNNIGITFAESPLIKKAFLKYKPKSILDIAKCLAIIRPGAKLARLDDSENAIIYDDDAILLIQQLLKCSEEEADKYRRLFAKKDQSFIKEFENKIDKSENTLKIFKQLKNLSLYSFCKAHALSYAQLIYALAYVKYHDPKSFWKATLYNCHSMYKKWVHISEAHLYNIKYDIDHKSIYSQNHYNKFLELSIENQLKKYGYWLIKNDLFYPDCYCHWIENNKIEFKGIIATKRSLGSTKLVVYLGYDFGKYIDCFIENPKYHKNIIGITGTAILNDPLLNTFLITQYNYF